MEQPHNDVTEPGATGQAAKRQPLWTTNYVLVLASIHLYFVGFYSTFTTVPLYLEDAAKWQVGMVVGSMGIAGMLVRPLAGFWIDRYGRRRFMMLGAAVTALSFAAYALTDDPYLLLPIRVIQGISMVLFTSGALAMTADIAPAHRRGTAVAYLAMVNNVAQLYAPWAALAIAETWGFTSYFSIAAVVTAGSFVAASPISERRTPVTSPAEFSAVTLVSRLALLPASVSKSVPRSR